MITKQNLKIAKLFRDAGFDGGRVTHGRASEGVSAGADVFFKGVKVGEVLDEGDGGPVFLRVWQSDEGAQAALNAIEETVRSEIAPCERQLDMTEENVANALLSYLEARAAIKSGKKTFIVIEKTEPSGWVEPETRSMTGSFGATERAYVKTKFPTAFIMNDEIAAIESGAPVFGTKAKTAKKPSAKKQVTA